MADFFATNRLTSRKKSILAEVLVQKGVSCTYRQNEFLFKPTTTNTHFWSICSKTQCVLPLNAVQYGAKRKVKWRKTQCKMPLNARRKT